MPTARRMYDEYQEQLGRERRRSWRSLNWQTPAKPEVLRLSGIVRALARLLGEDETKP